MAELNLHSEAVAVDAMGTQLELLLLHRDRNYLRAVVNEIEEEVAHLESRLSRFIPHSEISRINRAAAEKPVRLDPDLFSILQLALKFSQLTDGAFDITVAPFMRELGFYGKSDPVGDSHVRPDARERTGYRHIELDESKRTIRFARPGMELDLGGMGKGLTVDRIVDMLRDREISSGFISFGGSSIYALGGPEAQSDWPFSFKVSEKPELAPISIRLRDEGFSMSASYIKRSVRGSQSYGHIIDPADGQPADTMLATAVIHQSALHAEILSTALMVMGWEKAHVFLSRHTEYQAYLVLPYLNEYQVYKINS